jgi:hypothetical protein
MGRREQLTPVLRRVLEVGRYAARQELHAVELYFVTERATEGLWREFGAEILGDWILAHPGSRPWAWWQWDAQEPRAAVRGAELLVSKTPTDYEWVWRGHLGVPAFVQCRPRGCTELPQVESQASYLARLKLFARGERSTLSRVAFAPEEINPFLTYEGVLEELQERGARRRAEQGAQRPSVMPTARSHSNGHKETP